MRVTLNASMLACCTTVGIGGPIDCDPLETKLTASDGSLEDYFGYSVSISGETALIGAYEDNDNGGGSGSAYVYERQQDGTWQETKLTASDGAYGDSFGYSVSLSGETALIGARLDGAGSAYIYERQQDGTWQEITKLTASDGEGDDRFGSSVSLLGDTALIGAVQDTDNGYRSGTAYVYERQQDGTWLEIAKLTPSDGASGDYFGHSVSLSSETALIGAIIDGDNGYRSGSVYVYSATWQEIAKLTPIDGAANDFFGYSVSHSGETALIGAPGDDDNGLSSGSVYVYGSTWLHEIAKLTPSDGADTDGFGGSVSLSGETALIGASGDDGHGSAYAYERQQDGTWQEIAKLTPSDGNTDDNFGFSVSLSGETALVGASWEDTPFDSGGAYVYINDNGELDACECVGDTNDDGDVDMPDITTLISAWGSNDAACDTNADGEVDVRDLLLLLEFWGPCP